MRKRKKMVNVEDSIQLLEEMNLPSWLRCKHCDSILISKSGYRLTEITKIHQFVCGECRKKTGFVMCYLCQKTKPHAGLGVCEKCLPTITPKLK